MTPLEKKLDAIKYCIEIGADEDAEEHIFDLLKGIRLKRIDDNQLSPSGKELKDLWKEFPQYVNPRPSL